MEWINVKDRYPEDEEKVLVIWWGEVCSAIYYKNSHWNIFGYASHESKYLDLNDKNAFPVYFWAKMPLPLKEEVERAKL